MQTKCSPLLCGCHRAAVTFWTAHSSSNHQPGRFMFAHLDFCIDFFTFQGWYCWKTSALRSKGLCWWLAAAWSDFLIKRLRSNGTLGLKTLPSHLQGTPRTWSWSHKCHFSGGMTSAEDRGHFGVTPDRPEHSCSQGISPSNYFKPPEPASFTIFKSLFNIHSIYFMVIQFLQALEMLWLGFVCILVFFVLLFPLPAFPLIPQRQQKPNFRNGKEAKLPY